ncbi:hypothetical protein [Candidatus Oscillochloris fontis]|uniref:hypothetical protein n=1 Tax=Candidatus Oscillochloris fontis TaxID=2496868 RepID=UPI00101DA6BD|nr:hypothetical protein [Candidatus Oscillochloris fontis]
MIRASLWLPLHWLSCWLEDSINYHPLGRPAADRSVNQFFALPWAERPGFTRDLCLNESPEPLKRRNIFAPPNFLEMV